MRKLLFALLMLISVSTYAHTMQPMGHCEDRKEAVFQMFYFGKLDSVEVQYSLQISGGFQPLPNGLFVTDNSGNLGVVVGVPQQTPTERVIIRFRWKTRRSDGTYTAWSNWNQSSASRDKTFKNCDKVISLPVKFSALSVEQIDPETLLVRFTTYETEGVKQFNVQFSLDGKTFKTVAIVFPDGYNPNTSYKAKIKISSLK